MMSRGIEEKIVNSEKKQGISIVWDGDGNYIPAEQKATERMPGCLLKWNDAVIAERL